jgi:hypothetical protein
MTLFSRFASPLMVREQAYHWLYPKKIEMMKFGQSLQPINTMHSKGESKLFCVDTQYLDYFILIFLTI